MQLLKELRRENVELHCKQQLLTALCEACQILQQQTTHCPNQTTATEQLLLQQLKGLPCHPTSPARETTSMNLAEMSATSPGNECNPEMSAPGVHCSACTSIREERSRSDSTGNQDSRLLGDAAYTTADEDALEFEYAAPPGDPLYLFKEALCHPLLSEEGIFVTLEELQADATKTVKELSYLLYLYEHGSYKTAYALDDPSRSRLLQQMRAELMRHCQLGSVAVFGKNAENGCGLLFVPMPPDSPAKAVMAKDIDSALYAATVKQLGLTMDQMDRILLGVKAFEGILDSIQTETTRLQQEVAADITSQQKHQEKQQPTYGSSPLDSAALQGAANLMSSYSSLYKHLGNTNERQSKLQRLHIALNKTHFICLALLSYVCGCMTVLQCVKAFLGVGPFPWLVAPFCAAIAEYKQELQAQQKKQQVADAPDPKQKVTIKRGARAARLKGQQK